MTESISRVAIVTGGAGGLGGAIVKRFLDDGLGVAVADLQVPAAAAHHPNAFAVEVDVSDADSVQAMTDAVLERFGAIDVLVNNAGIAGPSAPLADYPIDGWRRVMEIDLFGVFLCMRACLPALSRQPFGRVVNIASVAGKDGSPDMSAYSAAKAGVIAMTKSVGKELARTNVIVNCVAPGVIDAGLTHNTATPAERELFLSRVPMGRMGRAEELAELVAWLASERCSFSTGATYDLTGGRAVY
jgi:3-oxoacyl-[acyl-carrier protein] reductase